MHRIRSIVREIHRRSLWQVLGIYLVGAWIVIQVVDVLAENMSLPHWTFPFAVVLLLIGLPIVLATAFVQEGIAGPKLEGEDPASQSAAAGHAPATDTDVHRPQHRLFTWRNAALGGIVAFALWGVVAAGWLVISGPAESGDALDVNRSIAVLPFASVQKDDESQAFVAGIHDDLLTQLSKIDSLTVISRTSVMKYRDSQLGIPDIARELGVATVLEGGVQRAGQRVRVNVQLIEAESDKHLWAETYDEELTAANIFEIQSDLARKIAAALRTRLTPETRARIETRPTESLEAYDLVARGRFVLNSRTNTRDGVEAAADLFRAAIAADSGYAPAHVGLASTYFLLWNLGYLKDDEALPLVRAGAQRALQLDPELAEAYALQGSTLRAAGEYAAAERAFRRALELNPGSAGVHSGYSALLLELGRTDEAVRESRRALELDPQSAQVRLSLVSRLVFAQQYDETLEEIEKLLEIKPDLADAHYYAGIAFTGKGDHAHAIQRYETAIEMNPEDPYFPAGLAWAHARNGDRARALAALGRAEAMGAPIKESALVYAALGDLDRAFDLLERAYRRERATLSSIEADPGSKPLQSDPRWSAFLRRLGRE